MSEDGKDVDAGERDYERQAQRRRDSMVWVVFVAAQLAAGKGVQHASNGADTLLERFQKRFKDVT